jgi:hypothetical protein
MALAIRQYLFFGSDSRGNRKPVVGAGPLARGSYRHWTEFGLYGLSQDAADDTECRS